MVISDSFGGDSSLQSGNSQSPEQTLLSTDQISSQLRGWLCIIRQLSVMSICHVMHVFVAMEPMLSSSTETGGTEPELCSDSPQDVAARFVSCCCSVDVTVLSGSAICILYFSSSSVLMAIFKGMWYGDGAGNTIEENSNVFSIIRMC